MPKNAKKCRKNALPEQKFYCKYCNFSTCKNSNYVTHLKTKKHLYNTLEGNFGIKKPQKNADKKLFNCNCGKTFKSNSGLWKHKKKCKIKKKEDNIEISSISKKDFQNFHNNTDHKEIDIDKKLKQIQLENELLKQQKLKMDIAQMNKNVQNPKNGHQGCKNYVQFGDGGNQTYNNNNISINMYLNENCKNAMSLEDFMQNIKISLQDLDYTTKNGYMAGISNILMSQLDDIAPNERPIHCSDQKRLQFYIKEDDEWKKDQNNQKINSSINKIKIKQYDKIDKWMEENPNWQNDSSLIDEYQHMVDKIAGPLEPKAKMKLSKKIQKELAKATNIKDEIEKMKNK